MVCTKNPDTAAWLSSRLHRGRDGLTIIGQLGQSLDGQIATATGQSKYINGEGGLTHLHRLRAWADAVIIGVGTLVADNPRLNVRYVQGEDPARVVIDPTGRAPRDALCLADDHVRRILLVGSDWSGSAGSVSQWPESVEVCRIASKQGARRGSNRLDMGSVRQWLAAQGWRNVLVEGGSATLASFIESGDLDYLHLITSPVLLGPGTRGVRAPAVMRLGDAPRLTSRVYPIGTDLLIECAFE